MKSNVFNKNFISAIKLCLLGVLIGVLGGAVGAAFAHLLSLVAHTRESFPWLILLLPLGGVVTVALYRALRMSDHGGTNEVIRGVEKNGPIRALAAPLIFVCTAITHLLGGSAGREGAAIQLGGAGASALSDVLRLKDNERLVFIMCGMSAVFAGVFGTPLTAAVFILEFRSDKKKFFLSVLPCFISALIAGKLSKLLGVAEETAHISNVAPFELMTILKIIALAVGVSLLGFVMCFVFHKAEKLSKNLISNHFIRIIIGAVVIIGLTALVGDMRYNGSGMEMALGAVEGRADWFDFIMKLAFTAITLAAGFKGGEIVPTFCIGATFGCFIGGALGLDVGFAAALGLVGLFSCVTNSLIASVFLGVELFGISALPYFILICLIIWPLSTNNGLFHNRFFKSPIFYKKTNNI